MNKIQTLNQILTDIESEMRSLHLWQSELPSQQALQSQQPFCCDTLSFEQWLQFVLMPKLRFMLDNSLSLPVNIAVCPMAEESFKYLGIKVGKLVNLIADIDELLSGRRQQTLFTDNDF